MNKVKTIIQNNFSEAKVLLDQFLKEEHNIDAIEMAGSVLIGAIKNGNKIISCGNGGSMCDAMHFAEELSGRFREDRKALPAIAISDPSHITCVANDYGFEYVFSRYIEGVGKPGDVLLAISTSGNSKNVVNAAQAAKQANMRVISLTGKEGGELAGLSDVEIRVPSSDYADRVQELHIKIIHSLIQIVESAI